MDVADVLGEFYPNLKWSLMGNDYSDIVWLETPAKKPTKADLIEKWGLMQYKLRREYGPTGEQLDALWHAIDQGIPLKESGFYLMNKAVKDANPKPE